MNNLKNNLKNNFYKNLKFLKETRKLTQMDISTGTNIPRNVIGSYMEERAFPKIDKLLSLCTYFHCSLSDMVTEDLRENSKYHKPQ